MRILVQDTFRLNACGTAVRTAQSLVEVPDCYSEQGLLAFLNEWADDNPPEFSAYETEEWDGTIAYFEGKEEEYVFLN